MRTLPCALGLVCIVLWWTTASASQTVGWIERFSRTADGYELIRQGQRVPVSIYTPLENGDRLSVQGESCEIALFYTDGRSLTLKRENAPYVVQSNAEAPSVLGNIMDWAQEVLDRWGSAHQAGANRMELRSRSVDVPGQPPLAIPMLQNGVNRLKAGRRVLLVAWDSGEGPFDVSLAGANGLEQNEFLFAAKGIDEKLASIPGQLFEPGQKYIFKVTGVKNSVTHRILAVEEYEQPTPPVELAQSSFSEDFKAVLYAAWLAENHPDWRLEAYQSLASAAHASTLVETFKTSIVKGDFPE